MSNRLLRSIAVPDGRQALHTARNTSAEIVLLPAVPYGVTRHTRPETQHATRGRYLRTVIRIYLGHGASGSAASMAPWVEGLRARGFEAHALELPRRRAEDAVAAMEAQVPDEPGVVVGGHSYGGRVASLSAAGTGPAMGGRAYAGLVCLSYPLHRPGAPETAAARTAHWPRIACPTLLLSGTSDPFARIDLLDGAVPLLPDARLVTYPRLGHTLKAVLPDALDRVAAFLAAIRDGEAGAATMRR